MYPIKYQQKSNSWLEFYVRLTPIQQRHLYILLAEPFSLLEVDKQVSDESELGKIMLDAIF